MINKPVLLAEKQSSMIIENIDVLKIWLVRTLEPICDADPAALAKYVIALAKKDKPHPELQALCEDQLDVFLGDSTKDFVKQLFETLQSKSYLEDVVKPEDAAVPPVKKEEPKEEPEEEEPKGTKRKSIEDSANESEKIQRTEDRPDVGNKKQHAPLSENDKENVNQVQQVIKKEKEDGYESNPEVAAAVKVSEKVDKEKPLRTSTRQSRKDAVVEDAGVDDVSMRSVSVDRSAKSLSPPATSAASRSSRHGHSSRRRRSRSPKRSSRHTRSSRRKSPSRRDDRDDRNKESSSSKSSSRRKEKEKEKCRDYEEKGFCMLGEVCPYDHGYDPVEVDDTNLPQMLSLAGLPPSTQPNQPPHPTQLPLQRFPPNVIPAAAAPILPPGLSGSLSLNTGLTTVQVQNARPIPSPAELPGHQVPIFRPRNPLAFMQRNISPPGVRGVAPVVPPMGLPTQTPKTTGTDPAVPAPSNNTAYNPEEPSIESSAAKTIKSALKTSGSSSRKDGDRRSGVDDDGHRKRSSATADEENRTQDELVAIAMGKVPLTPIVGSQPAAIFPPGADKTDVQQQVTSGQLPAVPPLVLPANPYRPGLVQPLPVPPQGLQPQILQPGGLHPAGLQPRGLLPVQLTVQQQYHQLQLQQQQQAAVAIAQQQQAQAQQLAQQQQQQQQQPPHHQQQQHHHQQQQQQQQQHHQQHGKPYRKYTILELQKIPAHLNNMVRLTEFFQKFGVITRIQTPYNNDPQSALIEFSQPQEATAAYNCPDAILGNRFIKMYWHNPSRPKISGGLSGGAQHHQQHQQQHQQQQHQQHPAQQQQQQQQQPRPPRSRPPPIEQLTYTNPILKNDPKTLQMEKKNELNKLKMELLKKKQNHYEELTKKQKEIFAKLQKDTVTKEEKARLLKAFKAADAAAQKLKKELQEEAMKKPHTLTAVPVQPVVKNLKEATKAILDKEMDIHHLHGDALVEAKKDLAKLQSEVMTTWGSLDEQELSEARNVIRTVRSERSQAGGGGTYVPRGRGGFRGRGRSSWYSSGPRGRGGRGGGGGRGGAAGGLPYNNPLNIDKRPKEIIVSGYDLAHKDEIVKHFAKFGQLDRIEEHDSNSMKLTFPTRKAAEIAAEQGTTFQGTQLVLAWFTAEAAAAHQRKEQAAQQQQQQQQQTQQQQPGEEQMAVAPIEPEQQPQQVAQAQPQATGESVVPAPVEMSQSLEEKELDEEWLEMDKEEEEMLLADVEDDDDDETDNERSWRR